MAGMAWTGRGCRRGLREEAKAQGLALEIVCTAELYRSAAEIEAYRQPFVTDDPSFGRVNGQGVLEDILERERLPL